MRSQALYSLMEKTGKFRMHSKQHWLIHLFSGNTRPTRPGSILEHIWKALQIEALSSIVGEIRLDPLGPMGGVAKANDQKQT